MSVRAMSGGAMSGGAMSGGAMSGGAMSGGAMSVRAIRVSSPRSHRRTRGFTLIEVMAASTIFLSIFVALVSGYVHMERLNAHQRHTTHAIHIAQGMMEELILLRRENAALASGTIHTRQVDKEGGIAVVAGTYTIGWETTPDNPVSGVRRVDVSVTWTEESGDRSLSLFTYRN